MPAYPAYKVSEYSADKLSEKETIFGEQVVGRRNETEARGI